MKVKTLPCKSAMSRVHGRFPYHWDLNVYRGCSHRCQYCFAMYTQKYLEGGNFFNQVYVKENIIEPLRRELYAKSWKKEVLNLGGVTDNWQPLEHHFQIMPKVLQLCIETQTPVIISTKSDLILRDLDLIAQLAKVTYVNIAATITCMDPILQQSLEPGAVSSQRRFAMLKTVKEKTCAFTGVHMMPIIPLLTDNADNLETLLACAQQAQANYVLPGLLNLRGETRKHFFHYIHQQHPHLEKEFRQLYQQGWLDHSYKQQFYQHLNPLMKKFGCSSNYAKMIPTQNKAKTIDQLSLFEL